MGDHGHALKLKASKHKLDQAVDMLTHLEAVVTRYTQSHSSHYQLWPSIIHRKSKVESSSVVTDSSEKEVEQADCKSTASFLSNSLLTNGASNSGQHGIAASPSLTSTISNAECMRTPKKRVLANDDDESSFFSQVTPLKTDDSKTLNKISLKDKNKFRCHLCGYTDFAPSRLIMHVRKHTGEKPFKCTLCARDFACKMYLKSHLARIHFATENETVEDEGVKKQLYKCVICEYSSEDEDNIFSHQSEHAYRSERVNIPQYVCFIKRCQYHTTSRSRYVTHLRSQHPKFYMFTLDDMKNSVHLSKAEMVD